MSRVTDLIKGAVELNLRYTSTLLHLSKDYLKDANVVLKRETAPAPPPGEPAPQRPPLLVVGRAGDVANAAFAINNPTDREINVHLVVQGELDERHVRTDPARFTLKPGEGTIVRILATIDEKLPVDRDHVGSVVTPGLSSQGVPFIVRRLPDVQVPTESAEMKANDPSASSSAAASAPASTPTASATSAATEGASTPRAARAATAAPAARATRRRSAA